MTLCVVCWVVRCLCKVLITYVRTCIILVPFFSLRNVSFFPVWPRVSVPSSARGPERLILLPDFVSCS